MQMYELLPQVVLQKYLNIYFQDNFDHCMIIISNKIKFI